MKKFFINVLVLISFCSVFAQSDYFVADNDTFFYQNINYSFGSNFKLNGLYCREHKEGKSIEIEKDLLKEVTSIYSFGGFVDRIPYNLAKPEGKAKYIERKIDGKIKIWIADPKIIGGNQYGTFEMFTLDNNDYYVDVSYGKNFDQFLRPILEDCDVTKAEVRNLDFPKKIRYHEKELIAKLINLFISYNLSCEN